MMIKKKIDIPALLDNFSQFADYDGAKFYFVFRDKDNRQSNGIITLMRYSDDSWTYHGRGDTYCDNGETSVSDDELIAFVWYHRAEINRILKKAA